MKKIIPHVFLLFPIAALVVSCQYKHKTEETCITQKIVSIENNEGEIWQYEYHDAIVYFIPSTGGDQMSTLYNKDCEIICHPDGGIIGRGDGKCSDFFELRKNGKLLAASK